MNIGYARVSTAEQNMDLQIQELENIGCEKIFQEKESGSQDDRPKLKEALKYLRQGDTLCVWKLDRLGRSLKGLIEVMQDLEDRGVQFRSITDGIDTTSAMGKFLFHIVGAFAEMERSLIQERTKAGLAAARARGRVGGRRPKVTGEDRQRILKLYDSNAMPVTEICKLYNISRQTFYNYLAKREDQWSDAEFHY